MTLRKFATVAAVMLAVCFSLGRSAGAQAPTSDTPSVYVDADQDFQTAVAAAMIKKDVPAHVVTDKSKAQFILTASSVNRHTESGASKFARCMFAYCAGIEGTSSVSVQLVRDGSVVWAYQVRKANGGPSGTQSLSEAIAKHLKNDFFKKQGR